MPELITEQVLAWLMTPHVMEEFRRSMTLPIGRGGWSEEPAVAPLEDWHR